MKHAFAILVGLSLALAACGGETSGDSDVIGDPDGYQAQDAAGTPNGTIATPCTVDADCPGGSACSASAGVCVALPPWPEIFSVEVSPDPASPLLPDQFANLALDTSGALDLSLAAPVTVTGKVFHSPTGGTWMGNGDLPGAPSSTDDLAAGRLVAVASGRVPSTQFRSEATVLAYDETAPDSPRFSLRVLPNLAYQVTFIPGKGAFESLPSFTFPLQVGADSAVDVVLPPTDAYLRLQGVVRLGGDAGQPVPGAQVSGRVGTDKLGSGGVTDAEGVFSLILPPGTGAVDITVAPSRDSPPFPTRHFRWDGGLEAVKAEYDATPFLTLDVDPVPALRTVSIQVFGGEGFDTTVPLARVAARGTAGGGEFSASTTTDGTGIATLDLLEGTYVLTVMPPATSSWTVSETSLDLTAEAGKAFLIRLDARVPVVGRVLQAATGLPVAGVQVTFLTNRRTILGASAQEGSAESVFSATTDALGAFAVAVDSGIYAMTAVPPARTGLPRVAYPSLDLSVARTATVSLPEGALVRGHARSAVDGSTLASATVRFYFPVTQERADTTWSLGETSFASTLQTAAEGVTDASGAFDLVLPVVSTDGKGWEPGGEPIDGQAFSDFGLPGVAFD